MKNGMSYGRALFFTHSRPSRTSYLHLLLWQRRRKGHARLTTKQRERARAKQKHFLMNSLLLLLILLSSLAVFSKADPKTEANQRLLNEDVVCAGEVPLAASIGMPSPIAEQGNGGRKKRAVSPLTVVLVSQVLSIITCSLANDMVFSDLWHDFLQCLKVVFSRENFLRGWGRCLDQAQMGRHRWRQLLKPQLITQMLRLAGDKLRAVDKEGRHYQRALVLIQDEFNKLKMDGKQTVRLLNIIRNAKLSLPDLAWTPIALDNQQTPEQFVEHILKSELLQTGSELKGTLTVYNTMLRLLQADMQGPLREIKEESHSIADFSSKFFELPKDMAKQNRLIKWTELESAKIGITERDELMSKFLRSFISQADGEVGPSMANQLYLHALLLVYMQTMKKYGISEPTIENSDVQLEIGEPVNEPAADQAIKKLVTCLIKLSEDENVYGKLDARNARDDSQVHSRRTPTVQQKLTRIENLVREDFEGWKSKFSEDAIVDFKRKMQDKYAYVLSKFEEADQQKQTDDEIQVVDESNREEEEEEKEDKCAQATRLLADNGIGEVDNALQVHIHVHVGPDVHKQIASAIKSIFFSEPQKDENKALDEAETVHIHRQKELLFYAKLAVLGHVLQNDFEKLKKPLNHLSTLHKFGWLQIDGPWSSNYRTLAMKFLGLFEDGFNADNKSLVTNILGSASNMAFNLGKKVGLSPQPANFVPREKAIAKHFDSILKETEQWLETTRLKVKRNKLSPGSQASTSANGGAGEGVEEDGMIGVPLRLTKKLIEQSENYVVYFTNTKTQIHRAQSAPVSELLEAINPRAKRMDPFALAVISGMATGFTGNVLSEYVDIFKTLRNWTFRRDYHLYSTKRHRREQRARAMAYFLEQSYHILITKVAELDTPEGKNVKSLVDDMSNSLMRLLRAERLPEAKKMNLGKVLLELNILSYRDFMRQIDTVIQGQQSHFVKLRILREFHTRKWIETAECKKKFGQIKEQISNMQKVHKEKADSDGTYGGQQYLF